MIILVSDYSYDRAGVERSEVEEGVKATLGPVFPTVELSDSDIGRGADWPMIVASLGGLFLLGKKINENLEAWCSLAAQFRKALQSLTERGAAFRVDEEACQLLALDEVIAKAEAPPQSLEYLGAQTHVLDAIEGRNPGELEGTPERFYLFSYRVDGRVVIVGMKSNGVVEFIHYINIGWMNF